MTDHETEATVEAVEEGGVYVEENPDGPGPTVGVTSDIAQINERMGSPITSSGSATEPEEEPEPEVEVKAKPKAKAAKPKS